jgi:EmrB/QacA subfamily drug resistance transporter
VLPVALTTIGKEPRLFLGVLEAQNFIQYGYLLTLSALLVLAGALSDYYGRRLLFAIGLIGFGVTSAICGLAPNLEFLVVARLVQGAAGAILVPGSLAILTNGFHGERQGWAFGVWAGATGLAGILGPFVGGVLVQQVTWRAIFFINIPFLLVALWATLRYVRESRDPEASGHFDWLGALLVAVAVGGLAFGGIYGQSQQWQSALAFGALAVGGVTTVVLPFYFARSRNPLVPLAMFRSRNFSVTNISTLLIYGAIYVTFLFVPLFMQGTLGYSPSAVGLGSVPGTLFLIFLSTRFGTLAGRYGPRWFMTVGPLIMAVGLLWFARIPSDSSAWVLDLADPSTWAPSNGYLVDALPGYLIFGFGISVMVAPLTTALMRSVPSRQAGLASAINNAISRVGPQLAGALLFVIISASFYATLATQAPGLDVNSPDVRRTLPPLNPPTALVPTDIEQASRVASTEAFHQALIVAAGLLIVGAAANGLWISNRQALSPGEGQPAGEDQPEASATPASSA